MASVPATALPRPSLVNELDGTVVAQPEPNSRPFVGRVPDAGVRPTQWLLQFQGSHGAVGDVLRLHYQQHRLAVFDWTPPGASTPIKVRYAQPLSIAWGNVARCSAQVVLETALAHE